MIARFGPIAGNLVYHAIEFLLKGALIDKFDEAAREKFRHNLPKLWQRYKTERNNPALDKFDQTISSSSTNLTEFVTRKKKFDLGCSPRSVS